MTDDTIVKPDEETSPEVSSPPAPADDGIQALLDEYDRANALQSDQTPTTEEGGQARDNALDELIAGFDNSADKQRIDELTQQVDGYRTAEHRRSELEAFNEFSADLQTQLPPHAPPDYAKLKLESLAHDPVICAAWDLRNVDRKAASAELAKVTQAFLQLQANPAADQKRLQELREYGTRLEIAVQSPAILRKARNDILNAANKLPKPIDEAATQVHMEVAAAVRGASAPVTPEPPPDLSKMSDAELRRYTLENFGF
jgi:hypothetical protein